MESRTAVHCSFSVSIDQKISPSYRDKVLFSWQNFVTSLKHLFLLTNKCHCIQRTSADNEHWTCSHGVTSQLVSPQDIKSDFPLTRLFLDSCSLFRASLCGELLWESNPRSLLSRSWPSARSNRGSEIIHYTRWWRKPPKTQFFCNCFNGLGFPPDVYLWELQIPAFVKIRTAVINVFVHFAAPSQLLRFIRVDRKVSLSQNVMWIWTEGIIAACLMYCNRN
jgi:hypothetical protein